MRRIILIAIGLLLAVIGFIVMLLPVPIPLIGVMPFAIGLAILSANSRIARRWVQRARHRSARFSQVLEKFTAKAPQSWARTLRRTRPDALARRGKMAAQNPAKNSARM
ncbi:MAG TPA: hypothetical protein VHU87_06120 [Rhizomicrobium sp.]|nr:hypothetical protein [Rhizomicrobium sp.]